MAHPDSQVLAERVEGRLVVHDRAVSVRWEINGPIAADGHALHCVFSCRVRALPDKTEQRMLIEALPGGWEIVGPDQVRGILSDRLHATAEQLAASRPAEHWLKDDGRSQLAYVLEQSARAVAFAAGLEVLAPFDLTTDSPSLEHQRVETLQRKQVEERAKRRRAIAERVDKAVAESGDHPPVIDAESEEERRDFLAAMIDSASIRAPQRTLCAISGDSLLMLNPAAPSDINTLPLPADLGPLRSAMMIDLDGRPNILVGARSGLILLDPASPANPKLFEDPSLQSTLGFNQCLRICDHLWACHGDGGLVGWKVDAPDKPAHVIRAADLQNQLDAPAGASPRYLHLLTDSEILFAMGPLLCRMDAGRKVERVAVESSDIAGIFGDDQNIRLTLKNGQIIVRSRADMRIVTALAGTGPITAVCAIPCFGLPMQLTAGDRGVECFDDTGLRIRDYTTPHRDLRMIAACEKWIAGLSADRKHVLLWNSTAPGKSLHELNLSHQTRHRIADLSWI